MHIFQLVRSSGFRIATVYNVYNDYDCSTMTELPDREKTDHVLGIPAPYYTILSYTQLLSPR